MKNIGILTIVLIAGIISQCGNSSKSNDSNDSMMQSVDSGSVKLSFNEYEHDFGRVNSGEKLGYTFVFQNKGAGNLLINSVTTSCGCTVPRYDKKPIPPGGSGKIEVVFDTSGKKGTQAKTITVKSNADTPVTFLKITADIVPSNNN